MVGNINLNTSSVQLIMTNGSQRIDQLNKNTLELINQLNKNHESNNFSLKVPEKPKFDLEWNEKKEIISDNMTLVTLLIIVTLVLLLFLRFLCKC